MSTFAGVRAIPASLDTVPITHAAAGPLGIPETPQDKSEYDPPTPTPPVAPVDDFTWTEAEERRVYWKLNGCVLLLLALGFYVFQLERGNISNALTDNFLVRVGITQDQFNNGQSLLYIGIILGEIPSQYILQWVGPRYWISFQVLAFGLVATLQSMQHNYGSFLATRIALGISECGFIPGALYTLSTFYKRQELATVTAVFFLGNSLASSTSGLLAYGILPLGTRYPQLYGWQWLMVIEGSMAIFVALLIIAFLPGSPSRPRTLFLPIRYFTDREERILARRVVRDDAAKAATTRRLTLKEILGALGNWRLLPHVLMPIAYIAPTGAMGTYGPTIIRSFNFDTLTANALSSVSGWAGLVMTFVYGFTSDRINRRGPLIIVALSLALVWWITFQQTSTWSNRWLKYAFLVLVQGFNSSFHPTNAAWLSLNCVTPQERSVAMAMIIMAANSGALVGSQLLRGDDAPLYFRGFRVCVGLMAFALLVAILQHVQYRLSNRRLDQRSARSGLGDVEKVPEIGSAASSENELDIKGERAPGEFRYTP